MVQTPPPASTPLSEVVVTAPRLPPAMGEAAFSVIRLDDRALSGQRRLDEALETVPAVSLFRRTSSLSANPTTQGLSLRAIAPSGAGRALVTLDGVPLNDPFGGWVIWSQVPTEDLSGLDIVRGAGAGAWGAGALTGVVALRERDEGAVADLSASERGGVRLSGSGMARVGRARIVGSAFHETSEGYVPVRGPAAGDADTRLDLRAWSAALRADLPVAAATVSLRASAFEEARGSGLAGATATARGNVLSATAAVQPVANRAGWRVQLWRRGSDLANTSVAVSGDRATTTPANDQYRTPATGWGAVAALRDDRIWGVPHVQWEIGADARFAEGETREQFRYMAGAFTRDRIAGGRTSVEGAYAEGSWRQGPWLIAGGLRADHWTSTDGKRVERDRATGLPTLDETDPDQAGDLVSARAAVRRDIGRGQALRLAAYSGFRPATLNELHRPFRVGNDLTEANAALRPERLTGIEVGWAFTGDRSSLAATVFRNQIEDAVVNVTAGQGPATFPRAGFVPAGGVLRLRMNAGTIAASGIEIDGRFEASDHWSVRGALSATDARIDGGAAAPQLTGLRPAQAPIWSATAGVDWRLTGRLTLFADGRYESRRFDDDLNSRVLDAALVADLRADLVLTPRTTLWLSVDNVLDAAVEVSRTGTDVAGYGPPRSFSLGLRLTL